jgi:hypothetical protein
MLKKIVEVKEIFWSEELRIEKIKKWLAENTLGDFEKFGPINSFKSHFRGKIEKIIFSGRYVAVTLKIVAKSSSGSIAKPIWRKNSQLRYEIDLRRFYLYEREDCLMISQDLGEEHWILHKKSDKDLDLTKVNGFK